MVSDSELQATSSKGSSAATAGSSSAKLGALNLEKKTVLETVPRLEKMSGTVSLVPPNIGSVYGEDKGLSCLGRGVVEAIGGKRCVDGDVRYGMDYIRYLHGRSQRWGPQAWDVHKTQPLKQ